MNARLDAGASGGLSGHAEVARAGDEWRHWPLSGNLEVQLAVESEDEVGTLTDSFNYFVAELRAKEEIKRTFGDVWVDLDAADVQEGRSFVAAAIA